MPDGKLLEKLMKQEGKEYMDYEESKKLARDENPEVRRKLAAREDVVPEILYFLAEDSDPKVREEVANNTAAPRYADLLLVNDSNEEVRHGLAQKISRLAPGLSANEQDRIKKITYDVLDYLAQDQLPMVRKVVSETLKDVAEAPPDVIRRLAKDIEITVSAPVLEFSPVLTDDDLLEIIRTNPADGALSAISKRAGVKEPVADAIADSDDIDAITVLLANKSAQIREETLDQLIDRAPSIEPWHAPLTERPKLPEGAAVRLANFVADNLLETLQKREDLSPEVAEEVSKIVRKRLENSNESISSNKNTVFDEYEKTEIEPEEDEEDEEEEDLEALAAKIQEHYLKAKQMQIEGTLTDKEITKAIRKKDHIFVAASMAVVTDVYPGTVRKVLKSKDPTIISALAWKAGLSPEQAVDLQKKIAKVPKDKILNPKNGEYPLSKSHMDWQLVLFIEESEKADSTAAAMAAAVASKKAGAAKKTGSAKKSKKKK